MVVSMSDVKDLYVLIPLSMRKEFIESSKLTNSGVVDQVVISGILFSEYLIKSFYQSGDYETASQIFNALTNNSRFSKNLPNYTELQCVGFLSAYMFVWTTKSSSDSREKNRARLIIQNLERKHSMDKLFKSLNPEVSAPLRRMYENSPQLCGTDFTNLQQILITDV